MLQGELTFLFFFFLTWVRQKCRWNRLKSRLYDKLSTITLFSIVYLDYLRSHSFSSGRPGIWESGYFPAWKTPGGRCEGTRWNKLDKFEINEMRNFIVTFILHPFFLSMLLFSYLQYLFAVLNDTINVAAAAGCNRSYDDTFSASFFMMLSHKNQASSLFYPASMLTHGSIYERGLMMCRHKN